MGREVRYVPARLHVGNQTKHAAKSKRLLNPGRFDFAFKTTRLVVRLIYVQNAANNVKASCGTSRSEEAYMKKFNTTGACFPDRHYMVQLGGRLAQMKQLVDDENYFVINRARQYGKTTLLKALEKYLRNQYYVVSLDFQMFGQKSFEDEVIFSRSFAKMFVKKMKSGQQHSSRVQDILAELLQQAYSSELFLLLDLFLKLSELCSASDKPIVLMIDETDSASNNQVFIDFLSQIRGYYLNRDAEPAFQSVILAGVYDIKNLKRKIRPEGEHGTNSPWNIAAQYKIKMEFSSEDIAGMLAAYENDHHTGMDINEMAGLLYDYTCGYPFLVSRLCQIMDETSAPWTREGFLDAERQLAVEGNTLFESLINKLDMYEELWGMLHRLLFNGRKISYNLDDSTLSLANMFGFIKNIDGSVAIANRIFETRLYNYFLTSDEMKQSDLYQVSVSDKNQFVLHGKLNMRLILEKFVLHFNEFYGNSSDKFKEEYGRKHFLLYLRPIINGTGNYYVEAQTRDDKRTDIIVDYCGEQYIVELKIWRGQEYNQQGEQQLADYLDAYGKDIGYLLSFSFNKNKVAGVREVQMGSKTIVEAVV